MLEKLAAKNKSTEDPFFLPQVRKKINCAWHSCRAYEGMAGDCSHDGNACKGVRIEVLGSCRRKQDEGARWMIKERKNNDKALTEHLESIAEAVLNLLKSMSNALRTNEKNLNKAFGKRVTNKLAKTKCFLNWQKKQLKSQRTWSKRIYHRTDKHRTEMSLNEVVNMFQNELW